MKDTEIFELLKETTGITEDKVIDYRPCRNFYNVLGIPNIPDALMVTVNNGIMLYIPSRDKDGSPVLRKSHDL